MILDVGLGNAQLYDSCEVTEVGGRLTLVTPPAEAANVVGRNVARLVDGETDRSEVVLTGAMAVWAYLVAFHAVVHRFGKVYYDDGRGNRVLIAQH
jgi:hypothetical protein